MLPDMVGAVIYVRVSTKEQTANLSLPTQPNACEEYCERQGFHVLAQFREESESAKTADRTELQKLLQFCRKVIRVSGSPSLAGRNPKTQQCLPSGTVKLKYQPKSSWPGSGSVATPAARRRDISQRRASSP